MEILENVGAACTGILVSLAVVYAVCNTDVYKLSNVKVPFFSLWVIYLTSAVVTLSFGGLLGGSTKPGETSLLYLPSFFTMTAIGSFRVLCATVTRFNPTGILTWFMIPIATGIFGILRDALTYGKLLRFIGENEGKIGNTVSTVILGSLLLAISVEVLIFILKKCEEYGYIVLFHPEE